MPKILITGAQGQVATALCQHELAQHFNIQACTRVQLDITSPASIHQMITQCSPDIIVNTAAYTAVDKAEQYTEQSLLANHIGARNLAMACQQLQIPLIHLSTDYIFDGTSSSPYTEENAANPINQYGESKWLGEQAIRSQCEQHVIVRVSGVFSEFGTNFFKTILKLAAEREELRIVADQITCPTYAGHIAGAIFSLLNRELKWGTYHYCDQYAVSWHEFASTIIQEAKLYKPLRVKTIHAISTAEYPTAAKRPAYSVLACNKIKNTYNIQQAEWKHAVKQLIRPML
jgi:dTDP-4-dehydrorhamnose reductase